MGSPSKATQPESFTPFYNPNKSKIVHFRNPPKERNKYVFRLGDGCELDTVENNKYLGTFFDIYLTFGKATEVLSTAANRALGGMINKFKSLREMSCRTKLYHSMVCPVLDYEFCPFHPSFAPKISFILLSRNCVGTPIFSLVKIANLP